MNCNQNGSPGRKGRGIKDCMSGIKRKCCRNCCGNPEARKLGKCMIGAGILAILVLCFPPAVWFVVIAVVMIIWGIKLFRM